ncbi:DCL family protein [Rhizobium leguminosarum]|uniref:DCL family protein n=1 Tax=Rhizobium leguminosarum TaxID=384 RepID=UPI001C938FF4|nr:DCL family protein [Rhizobium leguminosarum]MBY5545978.1 DCL family protein [Rhizobium leguminosarum]
MAKARSVTIGNRFFERVGDATTYFSQMLSRYQIREAVSAEDAVDLAHLLARHSEVEEKIGSGISYFIVDRAPDPYPGRCFWVVRKDGLPVDFAIKHCLLRHPLDEIA